MMKTLYKDIPLKSGDILTKGSKVTVRSIPDNYRACVVKKGISMDGGNMNNRRWSYSMSIL